MAVINIHMESYSECSRENGVDEHINNWAFEALVLSYSINQQEIKTVDLVHSMDIPTEFINAITDSRVIKYSFDTEYTVKVLSHILNIQIPYDNWRGMNYVLEFMGMRDEYFVIKREHNDEYNALCQLQKFFQSNHTFKGDVYRNTAQEYPIKWKEYVNAFYNHIKLLIETRDELVGYIYNSRLSGLEQSYLNRTGKHVEVDLKSLKKIQMRSIREGSEAFVGVCDDNQVIEDLTREEIISILSGKVKNSGFMKIIQSHAGKEGVDTDSRLAKVNSQIENWKFYNVVKGFVNNGCLKSVEITREDMIALLKNDVISCNGSDIGMLEYEDSVKLIREWLQEGLNDWKTPFYDATTVNIILDIKKALYKSAIYCILTGEEVEVGRVSVRKNNKDLDIILPSGRVIRYLSCSVKPSVIDKLCIYNQKLNSSGKLSVEILSPEAILHKIICHIVKDLLEDIAVILQSRGLQVIFQAFSYLLFEVDAMADSVLWEWSEIIPGWAAEIKLKGNLISKENAYEYV